MPRSARIQSYFQRATSNVDCHFTRSMFRISFPRWRYSSSFRWSYTSISLPKTSYKSFAETDTKQLLDEVFVISRIIEVRSPSFDGFSQFFLFHVINKQLLCHLCWPFCVLWVLVLTVFFDVLLGRRSKPGSRVFASSLTASNTKRANVTWLPLENMHRGHTWHDYRWPCVSLTWLLYNLQLDDVLGADFENSLYAFGQSEKR